MYTYKIYIFLLTHTILLSNMINYITHTHTHTYTYVYQFLQQNNFKMSIIILISFLRGFYFYFYFFMFWSILGLPIFCVKITADISPIYLWLLIFLSLFVVVACVIVKWFHGHEEVPSRAITKQGYKIEEVAKLVTSI